MLREVNMDLVLGIISLVVLYLIKIGFSAQILCNLLGIVYPATVSIRATQSNTTLHDKKWLTYWAIYAMLFLIEYFLAAVTDVIPFYWLIKAVFLIWCMIPMDNNGSVTIYHRLIEPYMIELPKPIEQILEHEEEPESIIDNIELELRSKIE